MLVRFVGCTKRYNYVRAIRNSVVIETFFFLFFLKKKDSLVEKESGARIEHGILREHNLPVSQS